MKTYVDGISVTGEHFLEPYFPIVKPYSARSVMFKRPVTGHRYIMEVLLIHHAQPVLADLGKNLDVCLRSLVWGSEGIYARGWNSSFNWICNPIPIPILKTLWDALIPCSWSMSEAT